MISTITGLDLVQIGWVVRDIEAAAKILEKTMGIAGFPRQKQFGHKTF